MNTIDYLRIAVTDRCNLKCLYCRPLGDDTVERGELLSFEEIHRIARVAVSEGITRIRLTGGEPTVRRDFYRLVEMLSSLEGLEELTLTTNGILLAEMAGELRSAGLSRVNISLDTLDPVKYARMTGVDGYRRVLAGIDAAGRFGLEPIKINVVGIKGFNDDEVRDFALFAARENLLVRFIEMMPFHCNRGLQRDSYLSNRDVLGRLSATFPLEEVMERGTGPATYYRIRGARGAIGFISPFSRPFCGTCNRLRLTPQGGLRNCLFSDDEIDMKRAVRSGASAEELAELIRATTSVKKNGHRLVRGQPGCRAFSLSQIGG